MFPGKLGPIRARQRNPFKRILTNSAVWSTRPYIAFSRCTQNGSCQNQVRCRKTLEQNLMFFIHCCSVLSNIWGSHYWLMVNWIFIGICCYSCHNVTAQIVLIINRHALDLPHAKVSIGVRPKIFQRLNPEQSSQTLAPTFSLWRHWIFFCQTMSSMSSLEVPIKCAHRAMLKLDYWLLFNNQWLLILV